MSDTVSVLQRIRATRPRPVEPPEERCELCAEPIAEEHGHLVDLEARSILCPAGGATSCSPRRGPGATATGPCPDRYRRIAGFDLTAAQWDSLQIPVSVAFFFHNSSMGGVAAFYPGPAGATESELPLDTWEEVAERYPELADLQPDVEAFLVRAAGQAPAQGYVVPIDACYELVGNLRRLWRGFDGGSEARAYLDTFFAIGGGAGPMIGLSLEVAGARVEPHAAVPTIVLELGARVADDATVDALALRAQVRIEPQRRRYSAAEGERLYDQFGEAAQWGTSLRPFLWTHASTVVPRFTGTTVIELPLAVTYDFEVAGTGYLHSLDDGEVPLVLLFSGTVFTSGPRGLLGGAHPLGPRGLLPDAGGTVAGGDGRLLPPQRLGAPRPRHAGRPPSLPVHPGPAHVGTGRRAPPQGGRGAGAVTPAVHDRFAPAQSIADAVLYEGYVLYPYRASSAKNQVRWQFGVLVPPAYAEDDPSERASARC